MPRRTFLILLLPLALMACGEQAAPPAAVAPRPVSPPAAAGSEGHGAPENPAAALQALYEAAKQAGETEIVAYISNDQSSFAPVLEAFYRRYPGIRFNATGTAGAPLLARIDAEFVSGQHYGDIASTAHWGLLPLIPLGRLEPWVPPTIEKLPARYRDPAGYFHVWHGTLFGLVYNENLVKPGEVPSTVRDLALPKWKGRFNNAENPPSPNGLLAFGLSPWLQSGAVTAADIEALSQQQATKFNNVEAIGRVAQGRLAFTVWSNTSFVQTLQKEGAPIRFQPAPQVSALLENGIGLLKNAPHPNAAKLFIGWLFTEEAQELLASAYRMYPVIPGIAPPPGYPPIEQLLVTPVSDYARDQANRQKLVGFWKP
jgi:iron(III) transport system substrate-binding protein